MVDAAAPGWRVKTGGERSPGRRRVDAGHAAAPASDGKEEGRRAPPAGVRGCVDAADPAGDGNQDEEEGKGREGGVRWRPTYGDATWWCARG